MNKKCWIPIFKWDDHSQPYVYIYVCVQIYCRSHMLMVIAIPTSVCNAWSYLSQQNSLKCDLVHKCPTHSPPFQLYLVLSIHKSSNVFASQIVMGSKRKRRKKTFAFHADTQLAHAFALPCLIVNLICIRSFVHMCSSFSYHFRFFSVLCHIAWLGFEGKQWRNSHIYI